MTNSSNRVGADQAQRRVDGTRRRGFTLVELIVAGIIASFLLGTISVTLQQLGRARESTRVRFNSFLRADAALNALRRELSGVMRADDLFLTRVMLLDDVASTPAGTFDRDEILIFNNRLHATREIEGYSGEGHEYEAQFRIVEDHLGACLWQRRDAVPDRYPLGGGVAEPLAEGIVGLQIEAYDGEQWFETWESDEFGLPWALRITVTASGRGIGEDPYLEPAGFATLQTVIPLDRILLPTAQDIEEEDEEGLEGEGEEGAEGTGEGGDAVGGGGAGGGRGGGGAGGGNRGGGGGDKTGGGGGRGGGGGGVGTSSSGGGGRGGGGGGGR